MIPRYTNSAIAELWSDGWTMSTWLAIERATLDAQRENGIVPREETTDLLEWLSACWISERTVGEIRLIERTETHHDVAAFLAYWRRARGEADAKWLHYGLTSSDLVDTTQGVRFLRARDLYHVATQRLVAAVQHLGEVDQPMLGMTHGQPGEPTSIKARSAGWLAELRQPMLFVSRQVSAMCMAKLSGPMGTFAHNPPEIERSVARALGLSPTGAGATQIQPRSVLALWAASCASLVAACAKIAHDLRLLAMLVEVTWPRDEGHVGSSAMPHKNNPIEAEQIGGLARLARGYSAALEQGALWLERDISNSSVERVAVPDLWHVVLHALDRMAWLLENMRLESLTIEQNLSNHASAAWSHRQTLASIADGDSYEEARAMGRGVQVESYDIVGDARWFMRNYPAGPVS